MMVTKERVMKCLDKFANDYWSTREETECFDYAIKAVDAYNEPTRGVFEWHPYPKETPSEKQGWYFVTWINEKNETVTGSDCYWYHDGWKWFRGRVTAWAYLPDPYEKGAEE